MDPLPSLYITNYRADGIFVAAADQGPYSVSVGGDSVSAGDLYIPAGSVPDAMVSDAEYNINLAGPLVSYFTAAGTETTSTGDFWVPAADLAAFRVASIPLAAMPTLSAAEATANAYPGDIRKILYALAELIYATVTGAAWTGADPAITRFTATRSTGESGGLAIRDYLIRAFLTTGYEVQDE